MALSSQSSKQANEPIGPRALRITGWLLIAVGFVNGIGSVLFTWLQVIATECWWISTAVALAVVFRSNPPRNWCRLVSAAMFLFWIVSRFDVLQRVGEYSASRMGQQPLGFMIAILGALLILTNDPHNRARQVFVSLARTAASRRKAIALVCVSVLIAASPAHSHSVCVRAATLCERQGAYDAAITFARLARDTFPAPTFCLTCYVGMQQDLTWRIEAKRDGVLGPQMFDKIAPRARSTAITAQPESHTRVRTIAARRPMGE